MTEIVYSPAARRDLEQAADRIVQTLGNTQGMPEQIDSILRFVYRLADFPLFGTPLSSVTETDTDYRFFVCGSNYVFYRIHTNRVCIDRILNNKQEQVSVLFGD